jgi:hypothetical protein
LFVFQTHIVGFVHKQPEQIYLVYTITCRYCPVIINLINCLFRASCRADHGVPGGIHQQGRAGDDPRLTGGLAKVRILYKLAFLPPQAKLILVLFYAYKMPTYE